MVASRLREMNSKELWNWSDGVRCHGTLPEGLTETYLLSKLAQGPNVSVVAC
jgi:hypothetical protein